MYIESSPLLRILLLIATIIAAATASWFAAGIGITLWALLLWAQYGDLLLDRG